MPRPAVTKNLPIASNNTHDSCHMHHSSKMHMYPQPSSSSSSSFCHLRSCKLMYRHTSPPAAVPRCEHKRVDSSSRAIIHSPKHLLFPLAANHHHLRHHSSCHVATAWRALLLLQSSACRTQWQWVVLGTCLATDNRSAELSKSQRAAGLSWHPHSK
jgi:hypothetical protein